MTREEAVNRFKGMRKSFSISIAQSKFYPSKAILDELCDMAIEALQAEPVKHGEWVEEKDGWYGGQGCRCSSCGYGYSYKAYHEPYEFDFCPNCGADMIGEDDEPEMS